ncbi:MAG: DNA-methyltransferase [Anaerolineae bacterium]
MEEGQRLKIDLPDGFIVCADSRDMREVADESVQLVVTSPPYNVSKGYAGYRDRRPLHEYLDFLDAVWQECHRVLCRGGRMAVNVANTDRTPYIPLSALITTRLLDLGFLMRGEIIWDKGASVGVSTAWGSFARPTNPVLRDVHEYILVFCKEDWRLPGREEGSGIQNQDFVDWTRSIWQIPTESASRVGHPAPFPEELPRRLILLYTSRGDTVLDPFLGSGTTAVAAARLGRRYVGYDVSPEYCELARRRLGAIQGAFWGD